MIKGLKLPSARFCLALGAAPRFTYHGAPRFDCAEVGALAHLTHTTALRSAQNDAEGMLVSTITQGYAPIAFERRAKIFHKGATPYGNAYTAIAMRVTSPWRGRSKQDKAHRKKQGEGVEAYVEPLLRSNVVLRCLYRNRHARHFPLAREKQARQGAPQKARRRRRNLRRAAFEEQRSIAMLIPRQSSRSCRGQRSPS